MFGRKKPRPAKEATFSGWLEKDIRFFASSFAKERAHLGGEIIGIRHSTQFCGEAFSSAVRISRSDSDFYSKYALAFDDPPADEDSHLLAVHNHELVGFTDYPRVRMRCHFYVGKLDEIKEGNLGWLRLTSEQSGECLDDYHPMILVHFNVQTVEQEIDLRRTMQSALSSRGSAGINFIICPIENADEWAACFMRDGYSKRINIKAVYAATNVGRVSFE